MTAVAYPSLNDVQMADIAQLTRWNRFLPLATTEEELEVINLVFKRYNEAKAVDAGASVVASKQVGWD